MVLAAFINFVVIVHLRGALRGALTNFTDSEHWRMQDLKMICVQAKFLKVTPIFPGHTHSEAHCLLNQQGLGWPAHLVQDS
jgi:hypothetical protein